MQTRAEHLQWCKDRANELLDKGKYTAKDTLDSVDDATIKLDHWDVEENVRY